MSFTVNDASRATPPGWPSSYRMFYNHAGVAEALRFICSFSLGCGRLGKPGDGRLGDFQDELETELVRDPVEVLAHGGSGVGTLAQARVVPETIDLGGDAVDPALLLSIPSTRSLVLTVKVPTLSLNSRRSLTNSVGRARPTANGSWLPPSKTCPLQVPPRFRPAVPDFQRPPSSTAGFPSAGGRGLREWEVGFPVMPSWPNSTTCCCTNEGYGTGSKTESAPGNPLHDRILQVQQLSAATSTSVLNGFK